jgi:hypothetical protein
VPPAQLDLAAVAAGNVNLLCSQSRARQANAGLAFGNVAATMDADGRRSGIEIGLKHIRTRLLLLPVVVRVRLFVAVTALAAEEEENFLCVATNLFMNGSVASMKAIFQINFMR